MSPPMIPYEEFGRLRLRDFVDEPELVAVLDDWEYLDDLWIGEAVGLTEFLRLDEDPGMLRAAAIDLETLPARAAERMLAALGLPLRRGIGAVELVERLGPPVEVLTAGADRRSYRFRCGRGATYDVWCTVEAGAGLISATILAPTPRRMAADPSGAEAGGS